MKLRPAEQSDSVGIHQLLIELGYPGVTFERANIFLATILKDPSSVIRVVEENGELAGVVCWTNKPILRLTGYGIEIEELVVSSKYRGKGIGTLLLDEVKRYAKKNDFKRIILSTNRDRESYRRGFYQKHGFTEKNSAFLQILLTES